MSCIQNEMIFESLNEAWDIRPSFNGVGSWEVFDDTGSVLETFDTLQEAEIARENFVLQAWEDMLQ